MFKRGRDHIPPQPTPPLDDLAMAKQLHQEAKEYRDEAKQFLQQSRDMHDLTMRNQRSLVFALSHLVPKKVLAHFHFNDVSEDADAVADNAEKLKAAFDQRDVYDIVHAINVLAMANTDVIHICTEFFADNNSFVVRVRYPSQSLFSQPVKAFFLDIRKKNALTPLLDVESKLTELVIAAREESEANAGVE